MIHQSQEVYKNDFETFLSHTNEKAILLEEIVKEIQSNKYRSILDIGAGNGLLSIPLSKQVDTYLAVEPKDSFVEKLRSAGIKTVHDFFPTNIEGNFDMVLSSHSISYDESKFDTFVQSAWDLVANQGQLLIITYRGQEDDWTDFMRELGHNPIDENRKGYNALIMLLNSLGEVKYRKVRSTVKTDSLAEMVDALAFVAGDGVPEIKEQFLRKRSHIEKIIQSQYHKDGVYEFPFWHYFISTLKDA